MIRLIIRIKKLNQTWSYIPLSFSKNFNSLKKKGQMLQSLEFMTLYKSVPLLIYSSSQIFWYCFFNVVKYMKHKTRLFCYPKHIVLLLKPLGLWLYCFCQMNWLPAISAYWNDTFVLHFLKSLGHTAWHVGS